MSSKWHGESEKVIKALFDVARFYAPSIIFIDEIDALVSKKKDGDQDVTSKVKSQILAEMDGLAAVGEGKSNSKIKMGGINKY